MGELAHITPHAIGTRREIEEELDFTMERINSLYMLEPYEVLSTCAALSGRLTELVVRLQRIEARDNEYYQVRTMQVRPLLEEIDRQFKVASRKVEIMRQELDAARGG